MSYLVNAVTTIQSITVPDVSAAPQVNTDELNEFFSIVRSCWDILFMIKWCNVPVLLWIIGACVVGVIVGLIRGKKS